MDKSIQSISGKHYLILFGILILAAIVFSNTLDNDFIMGWDDEEQVVNNQDIKELSWDNTKTIFKIFYVGMYQPLTTLTYALNYKISGMDAKVFHATNLFLHLINIVLVFLLFYRLTARADIPLIISALFAVHPMNVESIAWVSTRSNLLYALFYLLSLIAYLRFLKSKKVLFIGLTLLFFIFSLLSKASALSLPFVLILFDLYQSRKFDLRNIIEKILFISISLIAFYIAYQARLEVSHIGSLSDTFGIFDRMILIAYSFVFYLFQLFLPIQLSPIHYYPVISIPGPNAGLGISYYLASMVFLIILVYAIYLLRIAIVKNNFKNSILFGLGFFVLSILPTIHFIPIGLQIVAERYAYIPYLGLFFIIAVYLTKFYHSEKAKKIAKYLYPVFGMIILWFSFLSKAQISKWKNCDTLMSDVIQQNPKAWHAYLVRGDGFYLNNEYDKALSDYGKALSINPNYFSIYVNRADVYAKRKEYQKALSDLNMAIKLEADKGLVQTYFNRGLVLFNLKNYPAAIEDFNTALKIDSNYPLAYLYRGISKGIINQMADAEHDLEKAIQLNPKNEKAWFSLGVAKSKQKKYSLAVEDFSQAIKLNPGYGDAYIQRGLVFLMQQKADAACSDFYKAQSLGYPLANTLIKRYCMAQ